MDLGQKTGQAGIFPVQIGRGGESAINSLIAQSEAGKEESPPVWPKEKGGPTSQPERHHTEGTDTGPRKEEEERKRTDDDVAIVPLYELGRKHSLF